MRFRVRSGGLLAPVLLLAAIGCSAESGARLVDAPTPTIELTAKPTLTLEPTLEPTPTPRPIPVEILRRTRSASPNDTVSLTAETAKGARCSILVLYASGPSKASGVRTKNVDADGRVTWEWMVGSNADRQEVPITVTCTKDDRIGEADTTLTVR